MSAPARTVSVFAPAKVNLTLHVTGQRDDGYHLLDSLVVFASIGDRIHIRPGGNMTLDAQGPEAAAVPTDGRNLVLKVADLFPEMPAASFLLEKNLPVASGIGGGSADAAAVFRGLMARGSDGVLDARMYDPARTPFATRLRALGADIPVCLQSVPARMRGVGDLLEEAPGLPLLYAVLINPRVPVSTPQVFGALTDKKNPPMPEVLPRFAGVHELVWWLCEQRNDLEDPACAIAPEIGAVLRALGSEPDCLLARMSGSGATCFGLFGTPGEAAAAWHRIADAHPGWWVQLAKLGGMGQASLPRLS